MSYTHTLAGWCGSILNNTRWKRMSNTSGCGVFLRDSCYWNGRGAGVIADDFSPSAGGLILGGVTALKNTRGVVARIQGRASCSWDDSKWCSVTSNTREGSSNLERGTGGSWYDSRWCSVDDQFCLYQVTFFVYSRGCLVTPATSRRRALWWPVNARWVVVTAFVWLASRLGWQLVLFLSRLFQIQDCGRPGLTTKGSRLGQRDDVYQELGVWACGAGQQRIHDPRPPSISSPSLSIGTSHFGPRRQSREGFGVGLLRSRWGEAKYWVVSSWLGGSQILSGVSWGRLIKPQIFRVVLARSAFFILIGCWDGRLWQRRGGEAERMLHWGTLHLRPSIGLWPGPCSSPVSRITIGCWVSLGHDVSGARHWALIGWARSLSSPPSPWLLASSELRFSSWRRHLMGRRRGSRFL